MACYVLTQLPSDCHSIIRDFMPSIISERCLFCGIVVLKEDKHGRVHTVYNFACTESLVVCYDCYDDVI